MPPTEIPSEFAAFVRDVASRAFETLSERADDLEKPLRSIVRSWTKLAKKDKEQLIDHLIAAARGEEPPPAAPKTKRFKPKDVEKTLPKKAKAAPKKKKK